MRVFYTGSSHFFHEEQALYESGLKHIKSLGLNVQDYVTTTLEDVHEGVVSEESFTQAAKQQSQSIKNSDIIISDITYSSGAVGFHIAMALAEKKYVLVLRKKNEEAKRIPGPIIGHNSKLLKFKEYSNTAERNKAIADYINTTKKKLDSKFILIISAEIDRYLEWSSQENRMHKAQIVRDAIEKVMQKDKEYKAYLEKA